MCPATIPGDISGPFAPRRENRRHGFGVRHDDVRRRAGADARAVPQPAAGDIPPEVSGLVIFMIGISGGIAGLRSPRLKRRTHAAVRVYRRVVTLGTMVALYVWATVWRQFSAR